MQRKLLDTLIYLATLMSLGHHVDHLIRGNHVGWPVTDEVTPFTYSLGVYPVILLGLVLYRAGRVGPGYWALLSGGGALFLAAIHVGPNAVEPPSDIIELYEPRIIGWFAFAWLVGLVVVLAVASIHAGRLWFRRRTERQRRSRSGGIMES